MQPRILQIGMKYYAPRHGGIENNVRMIAEGLRPEFDMRVLTYNHERRTDTTPWNGVPVTRVGSFREVVSQPLAPTYPYWLARSNADLIHVHGPNPLVEAYYAIAPQRAPLVVTYHSDLIRQWLVRPIHAALERRLLSRAARIIVYTRAYAETSPVLSRFIDKCEYIPHGIDLTDFESTPDIAEEARLIQKTHPGPIILFVGRLVYYKGAEYLVRAMQGLDATLLVVGDGPMKTELESLAAEAGVADRTVFLGRVGHARKLACLHAADMLVLPSTHRSEAFGQVQLEAMACGKPVISTEIGTGVSYVNQHGQTGLVLPPADVSSLGRAIQKLIDDPALAGEFGRNGRARVEAEFTSERMLERIGALYRDVLDRGPGHAHG